MMCAIRKDKFSFFLQNFFGNLSFFSGIFSLFFYAFFKFKPSPFFDFIWGLSYLGQSEVGSSTSLLYKEGLQ